MLLPWVLTEDGIFFGALDRLPPDRLTAWQWLRGADVALAATALLLVAVGVARLRGHRARLGLVACLVASVAGSVYVAAVGLAPGLPDLAPGSGAVVFDPQPGPGPFVALAVLLLASIVALAGLVRRPRGATV